MQTNLDSSLICLRARVALVSMVHRKVLRASASAAAAAAASTGDVLSLVIFLRAKPTDQRLRNVLFYLRRSRQVIEW